jgi:NTE family protein
VGDLIHNDRDPPGDGEDLYVGLAFSGGGMRAAAFAFGVLSEFDRTQIGPKVAAIRLIDRVDFLSGVSGGAVTAAYFGLKGRAALSDFRERFLMRNAEESLSTTVTPISVVRAYEGGINDAQHFPRWLDDNLFHGATFRELGPEHRPRVWINASDIYNRTPFVFSSETFGAICSDLASYPIANAVAASAAMPVIFAPVVLQTFSDGCTAKIPDWIERARNDASTSPMLKGFADAITRYRDGSEPYIKLLDGGLVDNYGLSGFTIARLSASTPYAPLTARQATKIRRVLFLVIDGASGLPELMRPRMAPRPGFSWLPQYGGNFDARCPVARCARALAMWSFDADRRKYGVSDAWSCRDLKFFVGRVNFDQLGRQRANELSSIPTRFKMAPETVELVIEAGRDAVRTNPTFQAFLASP